ncbi:MAG: hypothetical protein AAGF24_13575 [Cyanobacteria bacterium P01_H01_bin.121]
MTSFMDAQRNNHIFDSREALLALPSRYLPDKGVFYFFEPGTTAVAQMNWVRGATTPVNTKVFQPDDKPTAGRFFRQQSGGAVVRSPDAPSGSAADGTRWIRVHEPDDVVFFRKAEYVFIEDYGWDLVGHKATFIKDPTGEITPWFDGEEATHRDESNAYSKTAMWYHAFGPSSAQWKIYT